MQERQAQSFDALTKLVDVCAVSLLTPALSQGEGVHASGLTTRYVVGYLVQAVLVQPTLLGAGDDVVEQVEGIGIPDVIEVAVGDSTVWLTVMDIKDSPAPRYAQQWQVAFYAALLRASLQGHTFALPVRVADSGVIVTRQTGSDGEPARHTFDLDPYLAALPLLQGHIAGILTTPVLKAPWQLQPHCRSCAYFDTCYRQALSTDDVMLLPHLTAGEHVKLRMLGLHTLPQAAQWFQEDTERRDTPFSPQQATSLRARVRALLDNRLELLAETTTLYPANIAARHLYAPVTRSAERSATSLGLTSSGTGCTARGAPILGGCSRGGGAKHASKRSSPPYGPGGRQPLRQTRGHIW